MKRETPNLEEIAAKVRRLRKLTEQSGFYTSRSVADLLRHLTPDELCQVSEMLELNPRELSR
jgi:hypothetical protein